MFRRKNKSVEVDFRNVFIKEFESRRYYYKVVFWGNIYIKEKFRKDLLFYKTDKTTVVYGFTDDFKIETFIKRINKILKHQ